MVNINVTNYSRKRKSIEVAKNAVTPCTTQPINLYSLQRQFPISTALTLGINGQQQLPTENHPKPFSFTSLLINGDGYEDPFTNIEQQTHQIIETQSENLRRTLAEDLYRKHYSAVTRAAEEELAAKRLREKETRKTAELKESEAHFRKEAEVWMAKARRMEEEIKSLKEALHEANVREGGSKSLGCAEEEEASSSSPFVEEEGVKVVCTRCGKRMATVMAWPCRHVSACVSCNAVFKTCSVCLSPVIKSLEIVLP